MKEFNKLVRDLIPDIIRENGEFCETEILSDKQFLVELNTKLNEEVAEYLQSGEIEELADILEVIYALLNVRGLTFNDLENLRQEKANKRGGFEKKIFLKTTKTKEELEEKSF